MFQFVIQMKSIYKAAACFCQQFCQLILKITKETKTNVQFSKIFRKLCNVCDRNLQSAYVYVGLY